MQIPSTSAPVARPTSQPVRLNAEATETTEAPQASTDKFDFGAPGAAVAGFAKGVGQGVWKSAALAAAPSIAGVVLGPGLGALVGGGIGLVSGWKTAGPFGVIGMLSGNDKPSSAERFAGSLLSGIISTGCGAAPPLGLVIVGAGGVATGIWGAMDACEQYDKTHNG